MRKKTHKNINNNKQQQKSSPVTRSKLILLFLMCCIHHQQKTSTTTSNKWHMREQQTKKVEHKTAEKPLCGIVNRVRIISTITNTTYTWNTIFINVFPLHVCCRNFSVLVVVECCGHDEKKYKVEKRGKTNSHTHA